MLFLIKTQKTKKHRLKKNRNGKTTIEKKKKTEQKQIISESDQSLRVLYVRWNCVMPFKLDIFIQLPFYRYSDFDFVFCFKVWFFIFLSVLFYTEDGQAEVLTKIFA